MGGLQRLFPFQRDAFVGREDLNYENPLIYGDYICGCSYRGGVVSGEEGYHRDRGYFNVENHFKSSEK